MQINMGIPIAMLLFGFAGTFWGLWRAQGSFGGHSLRVWLLDIGIVVLALLLFAIGLHLVVDIWFSSLWTHPKPSAL